MNRDFEIEVVVEFLIRMVSVISCCRNKMVKFQKKMVSFLMIEKVFYCNSQIDFQK